jgi:hypothetical protein
MNQPQPPEEHLSEQRKHWATIERRALWLNGFTGVAAVVGLVGLGGLFILWNTLQQAKTATEAANRAWVSTILSAYFNVPAVGEPVTVHMQFANFGHEPAVDVTFFVRFDTIPTPQTWRVADTEEITDNVCDPAPVPNIMKSGVITPGASYAAILQSNVPGSNKIIWDDGLNAEHTTLRAKACLTYMSFNVRRYTRSCRLFIIYTFRPPLNPTVQGAIPGRAQEATPEASPGPMAGQDVIPNEYHREPIRRGSASSCNGGDSAN